ncbi:hypothetical protein COW36_00670 [bacterium (Candidatus Blackallbacteria) CG17_big_fil_post_rev_8_21_14_2_50_48_46]|uniref:Late embryogenesis abundant protein LEA-2 subgroup domain-containing protein n=1 Tax=bacterium (Candidatus Blackallbacteria) CG17_big_fil_post_rev_8_21_14_2_50_48_46 TaxID=2014261 RepID=A0A2M7GB29_9BACT|nr:MAG: hypothetical protein COW64_10505 [bacterium (Candidatus Blackallbacteria) CG18_big_fil_WC_8_21_14_2_50_49_26]PIW19384.1 MAG: hypothetical protein COW36_00670 [bacterium (Candidatus Blackallbacteria) CG17_big_fil_post_rev_8_21_14_2_50_48_46]PIW49012.1 MAG: hypothetical protein COW20_07785 [bacterium (Candidatus Blackallbacteria) CG13_big_fil_rev_8_21_14_2_50_49_14]
MKLKEKLAGLLLASVVAGCGLYTNIPAQVKISPGTNGGLRASVTYTVDQSRISAEVKNPTLVLEGEPGSIGVTYDTINIEYLPQSLTLNPRVVRITGSVRVGSSHQFDKDGKPIPAKGEVELPIISSHVVELGNPLSQGRINSQISAKVTLEGTDDAGWPASLDVYVPINFLSSALAR